MCTIMHRTQVQLFQNRLNRELTDALHCNIFLDYFFAAALNHSLFYAALPIPAYQ